MLRAAEAGHDTLAALYPSLKGTLDRQLAGELTDIPDGAAKQQGIAVGHLAAAGHAEASYSQQAITDLLAGLGRNIKVPFVYPPPTLALLAPTRAQLRSSLLAVAGGACGALAAAAAPAARTLQASLAQREREGAIIAAVTLAVMAAAALAGGRPLPRGRFSLPRGAGWGVAGAILALMCCHLKGFYLTVVTLAFGLIFPPLAVMAAPPRDGAWRLAAQASEGGMGRRAGPRGVPGGRSPGQTPPRRAASAPRTCRSRRLPG